MRTTVFARRGAPVLLAAALLAACSAGHGGTAVPVSDDATPAAAPASPGGPSAEDSGSPAAAPAGSSSPYPTSEAAPGAAAPAVRDSFAVLQATYNDGCGTPGNCRYFLTRVLTDLDDLGASMKADPQGAEHFHAPLARIGAMQAALGGDAPFPNLRRHQDLLVGTRDRINTWMQSHPEDYR
ncbi:hypothetical protein [Streptomyces sp. NPDC001380]|uniref:hypothetical protein n=1 Tax=Streptomyces sp. NPDC001380 TaxID=3364566 RepID=UPI00368499B3